MLNHVLKELDYDFKKEEIIYEGKELDYDKYRELVSDLEEVKIDTEETSTRFDKAHDSWRSFLTKDINKLCDDLLDFISCLDETLKEKTKAEIKEGLKGDIAHITGFHQKLKDYADKANSFEDDMSEAFEGAL